MQYCNDHQLILYFRNYGFCRCYAYASGYCWYRIIDGNGGRYERNYLRKNKRRIIPRKSILEAYKDGFKHAISAIIDGHATTFITALILYIFGTGPIKGFAVTLMIGLVMTLFTSVILSRVMIFNRLKKENHFLYGLRQLKIYSEILGSILSGKENMLIFFWNFNGDFNWFIALNGFKYGIDFTGGRNYVVRFEKPVDAGKLKKILLS
jgi:SecD/SecF fusion protein